MKLYFEMNGNKNTAHQWGCSKSSVKGKVRSIKAYVEKKDLIST